MTKTQADILEIYNTLTVFSKETIESSRNLPIKVNYEESLKALSFEQSGKKVYLQTPLLYSLKISKIKNTYLLAIDYDYLMATLESLIAGGKLLEERILISPESYGFSVWFTELSKIENGPKFLGEIQFISANNWFFKFITKFKFRNEI